jgi:hypothetical protein
LVFREQKRCRGNAPGGRRGRGSGSETLARYRGKEPSLAELVTDECAAVKEVGGRQVSQSQYPCQ